MRVVRDTVYVERKDSVLVQGSSTSEATKSMTRFKVSGDSLNPRPSTLLLTLKWIVALIIALCVLVAVIKLKIDNSYT